MLNLWLLKIGASMQVGEKLKKLKMVKKVHSVVLNSGKTDRKQNRRQTGLVVSVVRSRPLGRSMLFTSTIVVESCIAISSADGEASLFPGYVCDLAKIGQSAFLNRRSSVVDRRSTANEKTENRNRADIGYPKVG